LLELVVYHKPNGSLQRVSEVRNHPVFQSIPYNLTKSSLALFLDEVLYKALKLHNEDEPLFNFVYNAIELLDRTDEGLNNFHLYFLLRLTKYLGFSPDRTLEKDGRYFDLREGGFLNVQPLHLSVIDESLISDFKQLLNGSFEKLHELRISPQNRKTLLLKILAYYALHIESFGEIKSHSILQEVLG
jgi:DNA repair protein RecO (recombination protein O)